ncbi:thiol peroxidase [Umboniibacter marinipuniceus]|uniref:Thiol peroxidase (Atypical 2-Cys peroxiredoxin) n=1 Tax=Umboniibacter marinipuniceus TaxID=569599 RepID=A0A3M0AQ53_9GAMM|nr:thiol peroxidase [Umboniibacter marinipuniceus]RMA81122.1 thiol peroxidase (atypical 2-Cys peroxiredoxin) [Umboniibacter marinipuniceus]
MAIVKLGDAEFHTIGDLPPIGSAVPDFTLTGVDLSDIKLADYRGEWIVLNIFPSIDTPTCQMSVREFNKRAAELSKVKVLCIAMDLPFAFSRFCGAEGLDNVVSASGFRSSFGDAFGVNMTDGPLRGLYARAVIVVSPEGIVSHTELVASVGSEPNYDAALTVIN